MLIGSVTKLALALLALLVTATETAASDAPVLLAEFFSLP